MDGDDDVVKVSGRRYDDIWGFGLSDFRLKPGARASTEYKSLSVKSPTFD